MHGHSSAICIHVYTAGYIYTHAHNRALHIRAHMSTTGLLYIYMCAHSTTCACGSMCRTWSTGLNTCIHDVNTCERSYRHLYTDLGIHIRTLLYPGTSTHAHVCTQAQYIHTCLHRKAHVYVIIRPVTCTSTSSYVTSHMRAPWSAWERAQCTDILTCGRVCTCSHVARQECMCIYTRSCYTQA